MLLGASAAEICLIYLRFEHWQDWRYWAVWLVCAPVFAGLVWLVKKLGMA
jgi:hypothetical protein